MKTLYSSKEDFIIRKLEDYRKYTDELWDKQENFSGSEYAKMINYFDEIIFNCDIHYDIRKYAEYCLSIIVGLDYHKQYERYLKLQKIRELK